MTITLCTSLVLALLAAPSGGAPPAEGGASGAAEREEPEATAPAGRRRVVPPPGAKPAKRDAAPSSASSGAGHHEQAATETRSEEPEAGGEPEPGEPRVEPITSGPSGAGGRERSVTEAASDGTTPPPPKRSRWAGWGARPGNGARRGLSWSRADEPVPERRFLLGVEGVVMQAPPLRPEIVRFDPRFLGRSASLGGLGLLGRLQVHPRIGIEATVRSGSVRYAGRGDEDGPVVSQDQVVADVGVLLYVARGDIAQLAFDAGVGGMGTRVVYELDRTGSQHFGSAVVRVGADAEFLIKRIAFVLSVRSYGVLTDRDRVSQRGALLEGKTLLAPVPTLQTLFVASAGIAYRF